MHAFNVALLQLGVRGSRPFEGVLELTQYPILTVAARSTINGVISACPRVHDIVRREITSMEKHMRGGILRHPSRWEASANCRFVPE